MAIPDRGDDTFGAVAHNISVSTVAIVRLSLSRCYNVLLVKSSSWLCLRALACLRAEWSSEGYIQSRSLH